MRWRHRGEGRLGLNTRGRWKISIIRIPQRIYFLHMHLVQTCAVSQRKPLLLQNQWSKHFIYCVASRAKRGSKTYLCVKAKRSEKAAGQNKNARHVEGGGGDQHIYISTNSLQILLSSLRMPKLSLSLPLWAFNKAISSLPWLWLLLSF